MRRLAVLSVIFALYIYIFLGVDIFIVFSTVFFLIGTSKLIKLALTKKTDLNEYGFSNFFYAAGPQVLFATFAHFLPNSGAWEFAAICGLSVVVSDTVSCEIGKAFSGKTVLITTWKKVEPGVDGGISFAGTLAGFIVSVILAIISSAVFPNITTYQAFAVVIVGFIGNLLDSVLGATLQKKSVLNNEQVNGVSISIMMVIIFLLYSRLIVNL